MSLDGQKIRNSIGFQLYRTFQKIRDGVLSKLKKDGFDLNFEQTIVLNSLWGHTARSHGDILVEVLQKKGNLTRTIQSLKDKGLVESDINLNDARSKLYRLTPKGAKLEKPVRSIMFSHLSESVSGISSKDLAVTLKVLDQVYLNLNKEKRE